MLNSPEFKQHFEALLGSTNDLSLYTPEVQTHIPELDDIISPYEVEQQIKILKAGKAAGADGVPPGIFRFLSDDWILCITYIFNNVFATQYPKEWSLAKLFVIYKKGDRLEPGNYRGISILVALAKIYDGVLNWRFVQWYTPDEEQAGGQKGRGCPEQLLTLRLFIDIARKTKNCLYILFVDYIKAYDRVNCNILLQMLADQGCRG